MGKPGTSYRPRYGALPRETQKAITALTRRQKGGLDCDSEMFMLMRCLSEHDYEHQSCTPALNAFHECVGAAGKVSPAQLAVSVASRPARVPPCASL